MLRSRIYNYCGITSSPYDIILFADHGHAVDRVHSRQFKQINSLISSLSVLKSICEHKSTFKRCNIVRESFSNMAFCDQAKLYSRARVVVAHHGANMANSVFVSPNALVIEIYQQCAYHTYSDGGYALLHSALGISYLGARVAYMKRPDYNFRTNDYIYLNFTKWNDVLSTAQTLLLQG